MLPGLAMLVLPAGIMVAAWLAVESAAASAGNPSMALILAIGIPLALAIGVVVLGLRRFGGETPFRVACIGLLAVQLLSLFCTDYADRRFQTYAQEIDAGVLPVAATSVLAWGQHWTAFALQPGCHGSGATKTLRITIPAGTRSATVAVTRPEESLMAGYSSESGANDVDILVVGTMASWRKDLERWSVAGEAIRAGGWLDRVVTFPKITQNLEIAIGARPETVAGDCRPVLVAVSMNSPQTWLSERGAVVLRLLSLFVTLTAAVHLAVPRLTAGALFRPARRYPVRLLILMGFLIAVNVLVTAWASSSGQYIFIWDQQQYWAMARELASELQTHGLAAVLHQTRDSLDEEYNFLPALLPALIGGGFSEFSRPLFIALLTNLYFVPACVAVYGLGRIMVRQSRLPRTTDSGDGSIFAATLAAIGFYPIFPRILLWGMPDIGGVVLVVIAILSMDRIQRAIRRAEAVNRTAALFSAGVLLAFLLWLLVLFRRWFLFTGLALGAIFTFQILLAIRQAADRPDGPVRRIAAALSGFLCFAMLAVPAWSLDRLRKMAASDYTGVHAAWASDCTNEAALIVESFGSVPLVASLVLLYIGLREPGAASLKWLTFGVMPLAMALFWTVQPSMSDQHLYAAFVPLMVASAYGWGVTAAKGRRPVASRFLLAGSAVVFAWSLSGSKWNSHGLLPNVDLSPPRRPDIAELIRLGHFVAAEIERTSRSYCVVGSSPTFTGDLLANLWQVDDSRVARTLFQRQVPLSQVDSRDGPPANFRQCDLALVADPVTLHLHPDVQRGVSLLAQDVLSHTGLGASFRQGPETFALRQGVTVKVFRRVQETSTEQWVEFLRRFNAPRSGECPE